ncbi:MAG TPA: hypothetical protein VL978_08380 [Puia sp.]|nr:hypothetical protein [Puia sp.]
MGKRKVTILEPAVEEVARIALFIEGEGLPKTAKKFVMTPLPFSLPSQMTVLSIDLASILLLGKR